MGDSLKKYFLYFLWIVVGIGVGFGVFSGVYRYVRGDGIIAWAKDYIGFDPRTESASVAASLPYRQPHAYALPVSPDVLLEIRKRETRTSNDAQGFSPGAMTFNWQDDEAFREQLPSEGGAVSHGKQRQFQSALAKVFSRAPIAHRKEIALTIDDGWNPEFVAQALSILREKKVRATLFPVGSTIRGNEALWQQAIRDGHELGNHTWSHQFLSRISDDEIRSEIERWQHAMDQALGYHYETRWFRPPGMGGFVYAPQSETHYRSIISEYGLDVALWDVDLFGTLYRDRGIHVDPGSVVAYVNDQSYGGNILLLHFIPTDIAALPDIIDTLRSRGYSFVTLSEITTEYGTPASDRTYGTLY